MGFHHLLFFSLSEARTTTRERSERNHSSSLFQDYYFKIINSHSLIYYPPVKFMQQLYVKLLDVTNVSYIVYFSYVMHILDVSYIVYLTYVTL